VAVPTFVSVFGAADDTRKCGRTTKAKKHIYQEQRLLKYYNYHNLNQVAESGIGQADWVIFGIGQAENGETDDDDNNEE
jgi:hypothetical protein